ncbi:MAG: hypothetical protein M3340_12905 [Actinomycetota bacterium]|nr:hypothetical protein [Actinomycetota bacterium]
MPPPLRVPQAGWSEGMRTDESVAEYHANPLSRLSMPYGVGASISEPVVRDTSNVLNVDLLNFRPPADVQREFLADREVNGAFHRIENGRGPVNADFYGVVIERMPTVDGRQMTPAELLTHIRTNFNDFLDHDYATFHPHNEAAAGRWTSSDPTNAVMTFDMAPSIVNLWTGMDDAAVVATQSGPLSWTFTTVSARGDWDHPVSGHRQFGIEPQPDGRFVFYTRGIDRTTGRLDDAASRVVFEGGDRCWKGLQELVSTYVNSHGGSASTLPAISQRHDWDAVKRDLFHPNDAANPWLDGRGVEAAAPNPADAGRPDDAAATPDPALNYTPAPPDPAQNFTPAPDPAQNFTPAPDPAQNFTPAPDPAQNFTPAPDPAQNFTPAPDPALNYTPAPDPALNYTPAPDPAQNFTPAPDPAQNFTPAPTFTPAPAPDPALNYSPAPDPAQNFTPAPPPAGPMEGGVCGPGGPGMDPGGMSSGGPAPGVAPGMSGGGFGSGMDPGGMSGGGLGSGMDPGGMSGGGLGSGMDPGGMSGGGLGSGMGGPAGP